MSSEVAAQSCPLISEGAEEGVQNGIVTLACGNDGGAEGGLKRPGVLISSDGEELVVPGTSDGVSATVNRWYDVLKKSWFVYEAVMLLKLAFPLSVMFIFTQLPFFITLLFIGHFSGARDLSATALGNVFVNITGYSVIIGIAMAADTLGPQSYGFKNYKRVGVILQRGLLILSVTCVPVAVIWLNSESILLLLRQVPCVVSLTGKYTSIFVLALPGMVVYTMLRKYMQAQSRVWVFTGIGLIVNVNLILSCAVFIVGAKLGTVGASLAMVLSHFLSPILLIIYIKWRKLHLQTWGGWSFESLTEWWPFIRLGIPGFLTVAFEWWSFEINVLVSGSISQLQLAISVTILQLLTLYFMFPLGMSQAVNVRVGNELGAGNITSAKRASFVAVGLQTIFAVAISVTTFGCRNFIGFIFTSDKDIVAGVGDTILGAIGMIFTDQIQGVISGVMRATGRQVLVAMVNFCSYYILGLPLGIFLALKLDQKAKGIWIGLSVASCIQSISLFVIMLTTNWKKQSEKAICNASSGFAAENHASSASSIEDYSADMELINVGGNDNQSADIQGHHPIPLDHPMEEEPMEEEEALGMAVVKSCEDKEGLIYHDNYSNVSGGQGEVGRTKLLYKSSKLCQSKSSILVCKGLTLLMCVVLLLGGLLMVVTIRHHPVGCDEEEGLTSANLNCSMFCYQLTASTIGVMVTPTNVMDKSTYSHLLPVPTNVQVVVSPTVKQQQTTEEGSGMMESDCQCVMMPTPSLFLG